MTTATSSLSNHTFVTGASEPAPAAMSRGRLWTGRILSGLSSAFLLMDGLMKVLLIPQVVEGSAKVGWPLDSIVPLGLVLMASTLLYIIPRTAFYGALLLTAYLGGAVATHVRLQDPLFSHTLFPVYVALMVWVGLTLRDRRLEALVKTQRW